MSSLKDENQHLGKQIGCMNGFFQIFDRHHFVTGRGDSSKRLLQGGKHQLHQQYAIESAEKEKPRISTESSQASLSSSSSSSTFSSLDFNRTLQTETLSLGQIRVPKECQPSSRSHDLRDAVKDSMQREVRRLCIKPQNSDVGRGNVMKHIDSPRPLHKSKTEKPKARGFAKDEGPTLPRFSYEEACRSAMKHEQLPRLSLDSKTSSTSALDSRLASPQSTGSHNRRSRVVARLMGLEALPDETRTPSMRSCSKEAFLSQLSSTAVENRLNQAVQTNPASPSSKSHRANHVRKPTTLSRFPVEPAPSKQQGSPKMAYKSGTTHQTSSVYGQIEKRVTDMELKKSGKDLRALKQILETMQKTRAQMEDKQEQSAELTSQRRCSLEGRCLHQNSNLPMSKNENTFQKANNLTPHNRSVKSHSRHLPTEVDRSFVTTQRMKVENFSIPGRGSGQVSPRLQQNPLRIEAESWRAKKHDTKKLTEKGNESRKNKVKAKDQQLSDERLRELSRDTSCQGETAAVVSERNNSPVSQSETEVIRPAYSISTNTRLDKNHASTTEHIPAVETAVNKLEQPSPISVLDHTFYCEDSPSPVKKLSTVFQEDESPSPNGAEWSLQNLDHLMDCTRLDHNFKSNEKLENMRKSVQELTQLSKEPKNESLNPAYRHNNKIFSSLHLINRDMFHVLEQTEGIREAVNGATVDKTIQRKMIIDLVDEMLVGKVTSSRLVREGKEGTDVLKEANLEMGRVSSTPGCSLEVEAADMKHHQAEDWVEYSGEVPAVVLDIERQVFKDLINEVITFTGEIVDARDREWPKRHYRKLFGK